MFCRVLRLLAVCWVSGFTLWGAAAQAASLQISPLRATVPAQQSVATYTLRNAGSETVGIQVSAFQWEQTGGRDITTPANELLVIPAIVSIPPGREQVLRVAFRKSRPVHEAAYRIHFQQLPAQSMDAVVTVQSLLKLDVPLVFLPRKPVDSYEARLAQGGEQEVLVEIKNTGTRFKRITELELQDSAGTTLARVDNPRYVLAGSTWRWVLETVHKDFQPDLKAQYQLQVTFGGKREKHLLKFE